MAEPMAPKIVQSTGERQEQQLSAFEANLRRLQDQRAAAYSSGWEEGSHHGYVRGVGWGMVCGALAGGLAAALAALAASGGLQ